MISPLPPSLEVALVLGGAGSLARFLRPARSVPDLIQKIDKDLARKLYVCHEDYSLGMVHHGQAVWAAIGGVRGLPHLISQARLLVSIVFELRKHHDGMFAEESERVRGVLGAIVMGSAGALWENIRARWHPSMTRIATFLCAEAFVHLSAEVEASLTLYDSLASSTM